ncbi:hypothetical protein CBR_g11184 [Chara braunii]|uniref:Uncharacterized protein n=1 Tax=Chara braunii TaxID=69332 RepID=A0A388KQC6_CHABU|nr:hypothetical protein CBR_g11184 [Chara braunii]|eukprot:GBG72254.1 hypothetical protein CBR_g11184 [Chara braunii]
MRQAKSRLPEDDGDSDGDEPLDLLDASRARKALMAGSHASQKETQEQDDVKYAPDGRMVIDEKEDRKEKKRKRGDVAGEGSDGDEDGASRGGKSSSKWGKKSSKDRAGKHGKKKRAHTGEEYKPQRGAGGDAKGNKKVEPYAYWPLDRKLLNRREGKRVAARKGMAGVMKVKKGKTGMAKRQKIGRK